MSPAANPRLRGGALRRPGAGPLAQALPARGVRREEAEVGLAVLEQPPRDRERDRQVGARPHREMKIGLGGERRAARIDHHQLRAALARLRRGSAPDGCPKPTDSRPTARSAPRRDSPPARRPASCRRGRWPPRRWRRRTPCAPGARRRCARTAARRRRPARRGRSSRRSRAAGSPRRPTARAPVGCAPPPDRALRPSRCGRTRPRPWRRRAAPGSVSRSGP